jgi:prepilin-type N-terminal cleavage/methylation domain-containing protein
MLQPLSRPQRVCRSNGLTLIELMIVLSVLATLIVLTAPSFKRMIDVQRLRSINSALVTDLQFARSEAASRNQEVLVRFDTLTSAGTTPLTCYVVLVGSNTSCNCRNTPVCNSGTVEIRTVQVQRALGVTVQVPSAQAQRTVSFDPATGRISVYTLDVPSPPSAPFQVEVSLPGVGGFITSLEATGRPTVCSPLGQISGVPACP